ncbi:MAG: glycosyltransferase family 4 protein [Chitinophagales bacterium]|nr:glycosyltransferase family 4 protein [Chitinophagales bacterium]MCO5247786.1 glycosyltransferase family 4 protein [Chitinophagales bacterium]
MTIFLVSLYYKINERTGANIRFDETAKFLISKGWDVKLIILEGEAPIWCVEKGNIIFFKKYSNLPGAIRRVFHFLQLSLFFLRAPQSIIINDFLPFSSFAFKKHFHFQIIHDVRNFTLFHRGKVPLFNSKMQVRQWQKAQRIITVSNYTRSELNNLCQIPLSQILVIYNGINQNYLDFSSEVKRDLDFLFIGVFEYRKNHKNLVIALSILKQKGYSFKAECVGRDQGTLKDTIDLVAKLEMEDMIFINNTVLSENELIQKYNQSKIFVSPSLYEGFGIPLIEAFASGCTVACSDITVFREVCNDNAFYFDPESPEDIARGLIHAIEKDSKANRSQYLSYAKKNFQWESTLSKMDEIFKSLS